MTKPLPKLLYKYRDFTKNHLYALKDNSIYFARSSTFNDPLDSTRFMPLDWIDFESFMRMLGQIPSMDTEQKIARYAEHLASVKSGEFGLGNFSKNILRGFESLMDTTQLLCLSDNAVNTLMWSHYSTQHTGFCIAYDREKLVSDWNLLKQGWVDYSGEPADVFGSLNEFYQPKYLDCFFKKSKDWAYEREFRLVHRQGKNEDCIRCTYPEDAIKSIIFGFQSSEEDKRELIELLSNRNINFKQALPSGDGSYDLKIVDYQKV